jgi:hypothetical protein
MPRRHVQAWVFQLACLLLACSLLTTTTVALGHDHGLDTSHSCDICHFGHMAWTGSDVPIAFVPEVVEEWRHSAELEQHPQDRIVSNASSRAPPVVIVLPA